MKDWSSRAEGGAGRSGKDRYASAARVLGEDC